MWPWMGGACGKQGVMGVPVGGGDIHGCLWQAGCHGHLWKQQCLCSGGVAAVLVWRLRGSGAGAVVHEESFRGEGTEGQGQVPWLSQAEAGKSARVIARRGDDTTMLREAPRGGGEGGYTADEGVRRHRLLA